MGAALGAKKVNTNKIANQAVTNKKIAKQTIKKNRVADNTLTGQQIDEDTLGTVLRANVGTGRSTFKDGATQIAAGTTGTVLSLNVPAGSYLFIAKGVLAKAGITQITHHDRRHRQRYLAGTHRRGPRTTRS